ncbi:hypothetical protein [Streptomyces sp. NPDC055099]
MTITEPIGRWRRNRVRRVADKQIADLRTSLDRLHFDWWPLPLAVRATLRQRVGTALWASLHVIAVAFLIDTVLVYLAGAVLSGNASPRPFAVAAFIVWAAFLSFIAGATREAYVRTRRCIVVMHCAEAIKACARAHRAGGSRRTEELRTVSASLRIVEECVQRAYLLRGTVARKSPRRGELRRHAGQVVAKLRAAESQLDTGAPGDALEELAGHMATIAEQYAAGHVGALLPAASLAGLSPVRDRELLRVGVTVVVIAGVAVSVSLLHLPELAAATVVSAAGILTLLVVFRQRWHHYLLVAEFFKPGP